MYDKIVKKLRELASIPEHCENVESCDGCSKEDICLSFTNKRIIEVATQAAEAIEELQKDLERSKEYETFWEKEANEALKKFQVAIASKPRWIPVTERLPPAEKEVYVTDGEYIARAVLLDEVFPGDKPCWSYSGLGEITHWCEQIPLPQLPKEKT